MTATKETLTFTYQTRYSIFIFYLQWLFYLCGVLISLGFLYPWFRAWINRYFFSAIRVNNQPLRYIGEGSHTILYYFKTNVTYILFFLTGYAGYVLSDLAPIILIPNIVIHLIFLTMHYHYSYIRFKAYQLRHIVLDEPLLWRGSYWQYTKQMTRALWLSILTMGYFYPDYLLLKYTFIIRHLSYQSDVFHFSYDQQEWDTTLFDHTAISFLTFGFYRLHANIKLILLLFTHIHWEHYKCRDTLPYPKKAWGTFLLSFMHICSFKLLFPFYMNKKYELLLNHHRLALVK